jgi:hypothetical protein
MMDMMQDCWNWMMSLGWLGMVLGVLLLVALLSLFLLVIVRMVRNRPG